MVMDTDESGAQTVEIVKRILSEPQARPDLQPWLDFQTWLQMDAPYRVKLPFKQAIFDAFEHWRKDFLPTAALRMRRDVNNLLSAIKASAVLHRAQRDVADGAAIVATLDDYAAAHAAFDEGLAGVHGKASEKVNRRRGGDRGDARGRRPSGQGDAKRSRHQASRGFAVHRRGASQRRD
jgi:hypothetical protein